MSEAPIPFITFDIQTKVYTLADEAKELLRSLKGPLAIVAIAGKYRTGKSFFLNQCFHNGFGVGNTVQAHTKGLWLHPSSLRTEEGHQILVVDTEGLGALDANSTHDTRIFALALLLSSYFVYNSAGTIDEAAIENLSLVANIAKHVSSRSSGSSSSDGSDGLEAFFPRFLWLVRDFTLQLVDKHGSSINSTMYLENALNECEENNNRELRALLKRYFPDRDCVTLVRPCNNEEDLQSLDDPRSRTRLRPAFAKELRCTRELIQRRVPAKTMCGNVVTGVLLAELASSFVEAINSGAAPVIEDSWTMVSRVQCDHAAKTARQSFQAELQKVSLPQPEEQLLKQLEVLVAAGLAFYDSEAIGTPAADIREQLVEYFDHQVERTRHTNADQIKDQMQAHLAALQLVQNASSFQELREEYERRLGQVVTQLGPGAQAEWYKIVAQKCWDWFAKFLDAEIARTKEAVDELVATKEATEQAKSELNQLESTHASEVEHVRLELQAHQERCGVLETQLQQQQQVAKTLPLEYKLQHDKEVQHLQGQLEDEKQRRMKADERIIHFTQTTEARIVELRQQCETYKVDKERQSNNILRLQQSNQVLTERLTRFNEFVKANANLHAKVQELTKGNKDLKEREQRALKELHEQKETLMGQMMEMQGTTVRLIEDHKKKHLREQEELQKQVVLLKLDLTRAHEQRVAEVNLLSTKMTEATAQLQDTQTALQTEQHEHEKTKVNMELQNEQSSEECRTIQEARVATVNELEEQRRSTTLKLRDQLTKLEELRVQENLDQNAKIRQANVRAACAETRATELQQRVAELENQSSNAQVQTEHDHVQVMLTKSEEEARLLREDKEKLEKQTNELHEQLRKAEKRATEAEKTLEVETLKLQMATLRAQMSTANKI